MAILVDAWTGDTAEIREKQLFSDDDAFTLVGHTVSVLIWANRHVITEITTGIVVADEALGIFQWPLGDFLAGLDSDAVFSIIYPVINTATSKPLTWPSNGIDTLRVRRKPVPVP